MLLILGVYVHSVNIIYGSFFFGLLWGFNREMLPATRKLNAHLIITAADGGCKGKSFLYAHIGCWGEWIVQWCKYDVLSWNPPLGIVFVFGVYLCKYFDRFLDTFSIIINYKHIQFQRNINVCCDPFLTFGRFTAASTSSCTEFSNMEILQWKVRPIEIFIFK